MGAVFPCAHEDFPFAIELIAEGRINTPAMFTTDVFKFDEAEKAFAKTIHSKHEVLKVKISYSLSDHSK